MKICFSCLRDAVDEEARVFTQYIRKNIMSKPKR